VKADRLLSILLLLQTRERVPAAELAERLEVSVRTIHRDIAALATSGVPVYAERGRHGGFALLPGFRTDVTGLTSDEAKALFVLTAQSTHAALGLDGALGSALRKLMAALPASHRGAAELTSRRIIVDPYRWYSAPAAGRGLGPGNGLAVEELNAAVFADRRLHIRYRHRSEKRSRVYTVDPYGLVAKAGTWYLVADRRGRPQLFRVDRMSEARTTEAEVRRRPGVELADAWEELRRAVEERPAGLLVRARVRRGRLGLFLRISGPLVAEPPEAPLPEEDDAWVGVVLDFRELGAVRHLLQFGAAAEVLEPAEVREELARVAGEIGALYGAADAPSRTEADREPG
jgi:predicted DNA-binding transcriptional regulator YafY